MLNRYQSTWTKISPLHLLALISMVAAGALTGCNNPTAPKEIPVAKATVEVINLHASGAYPEYDGACQTNGVVELRPWDGSGESAIDTGEPLFLEWTFMVDRGNGLEPAPDWGPGQHVRTDTDTSKPMSERVLAERLLTIGFHDVTLTVRTRDGRSTSKTLKILVTSCESCG